ncbi:MAG: hypothetical protein GXP49_01350 [Deltaproteobacteria bacterium]|nr:hypothetical protein [Deltaproteobacteria bacterium]
MRWLITEHVFDSDKRIMLVTGLLFLMLPLETHAAGGVIPDRGARAMARGGAFAAGPPDLQQAYYNPAGLAGLAGTHLCMDNGFIWNQVDFKRAADLIHPGGYPTARNLAPVQWIPSLFLGSSFGLDGFFLSFSAYGSYAGDYGYDSTGPQRYSLIWLDLWEAVYQLSAAYRPLSWLQVGLGLQFVDIRFRQSQKLTTYTGIENTGPREYLYNDITVQVDAREWKNVDVLLGVKVMPLPWLQLGAALRPPMTVNAPTRFKVQLPRYKEGNDAYLFGDAKVEDNGSKSHMILHTPLVFRTGARLTLDPAWDLELDFAFEKWDSQKDVSVKVQGITVTGVKVIDEFDVQDVTVPKHWKNAWSLRLGGTYDVLGKWLSLSAGAYYESSAVPDETASVAVYDNDKYGLALGATLSSPWLPLFLDIGYLHVFFPDRKITGSRLKQINPIRPNDPDLADVIGNGTYKASVDIFAFTVRYSF